MNHRRRTLIITLLTAGGAISGGAFVADASNHASFASSSSAQDGPGAFGRPGGPPPVGPGAPAPRGAPES
jgi:hypothetical protein